MSHPLNILDKAVEALLKREPAQWSGLICYILEALQERAKRDEYEAFLSDLQKDVMVRLLAGRW